MSEQGETEQDRPNSGGVSAETGAKPAGIGTRIGKDIITAMKAKDEHTLTT